MNSRQHSPTPAGCSTTLTYGSFTVGVTPSVLTAPTIAWFRQGACPLMAWALIHQAAQHGREWGLAIIGDALNWGDWWHMGAVTEDQRYFVDAGGATGVEEVCEQWQQEHRERRHPGHDTALRTVQTSFFLFLWPDPRTVDPSTRKVTLEFAEHILTAEGLVESTHRRRKTTSRSRSQGRETAHEGEDDAFTVRSLYGPGHTA